MLEIDRLVAALNANDVRFIVIGGVAVAAHGFVRATKDLDIVPAPGRDNLERLALTLQAMGAVVSGMQDFDPAEFPFDPTSVDDLLQGGNFVLQTELGRLDIMQWVPGIDADLAFDYLQRTAIDAEILGHPVRICSLDDLLAMKRAAGRAQDLDDIARLTDA